MKKIIFTLTFLSFITFSNAQEMSYGALGGISLSTISGDDTGEYSSKVSISIGGFLEYKINNQFGVQPELRYINVGAKGELFGKDYKENYSYIAIPVLGKYYVNEKFSLNFGPQIAFNMGAKTKFDGDSENIEDVNGLDLGLLIGASYNFTDRIFADARYNFGLSNIYSNTDDGFKQSHAAFFVSLGYRFN